MAFSRNFFGDFVRQTAAVYFEISSANNKIQVDYQISEVEMEEELEAAKTKAAEAEANMIKAAEYGKQILVQLNQAEQDKYSLKLQLENKEAAVKALQDDLHGTIYNSEFQRLYRS